MAMLLPSCKKINEAIDGLDSRLDKLEQETIPSIDEQIAAINVSLDALDAMDKELKGYIDGLQATADNLQEQINATNTKIGEVKAELQGEISTAKAEVLAELEVLETELKNELAQINATIETLKEKDKELDEKIKDLNDYVNNELTKTTTWVEATFATLEQYNSLVTEIATIKEQIKAINESIKNLETKLTTKINEDIANAVSTLNADIQQKVKDITDAYTNAIKSAKEEITAAYTSAIQNAINALDVSLKAWVGEQLANYYTIAQIDALLAALEQDMNGKLEAQKAYLEGLINELSATLTKSIADNKVLIEGLQKEITTLQGTAAEHASKIAENATAISTNAQSIIENSTAISKNSDNIEANKKLIADNKALIENNSKLIEENKRAIEALKSSTATAIAKNATDINQNANSIAKNASLISQNATAITNNAAAIAQNATDIAQLQQDLTTTKSEITEAYKKAIKEAIEANNGVIEGVIANEVATINTRINNEVATINATIKALTERIESIESEISSIKQQIAEILGDITDIKEDIAALLARIQSVSYIPTYDDGKATVKYNGNTSRVTLDFEVSPKDAVVELAKVWQSAVSVKAIYTQTRAVSFVDMPITNFESDATNGIISITASGENLSVEFFVGTQSASVRLSISDGNNSVTSDYISMMANEGNAIIDGVLYINTAQGLNKLNDPNISSAKLLATLDMTGVDWTPIEGTNAFEFDGGKDEGFSIIGLNAPLFGTTAATIKNLELVDVNIEITDRLHAGAIACDLYGDIDNCKASGTINTNNTTFNGDVSNSYEGICHGGLVGLLHNSSAKNCTNNIDITITSLGISGKIGSVIGGVIGGVNCSDNSILSNCKNYGTIMHTCAGGRNNSIRVNIGGVLGLCATKGLVISNCENYGHIAYGPTASLARADLGGIVGGTPGGALISNCKNGGKIEHCSGTPATPALGEQTVAGICGCPQTGTIFNDCVNLASAEIIGAGAGNNNYDVAGIAGGPSGADIEFNRCKNYGTVKHTVQHTKSTYVGGIVGYGYSFAKFVDCENYGSVSTAGSTGITYIGGIVGWGRIASDTNQDASTRIMRNCVNYANIDFGGNAGSKTMYAGGVAGCLNDEDAERHWEEISGNKNYANLIFSSNVTNCYYGGIFGTVAVSATDYSRIDGTALKRDNSTPYALAEMTGCVNYGNLKCLGGKKVSLLVGVARSTSCKFINSSAGGNMVFAENKETVDDPDGGEPIEEVTEILTPITADNLKDYIYSTAITADDIAADVITFLSEKPADATPAK